MRLFLDNCISSRVARCLHILVEQDGHEVVHLTDPFDPATPDIEWLGALGEDGDWVVVSGDLRISKNRHERQAWRESGLTAFFLAKGWTNLKLWDSTWMLVRWWPRIMEQAELAQSGAGFEIPQKATGKFRIILPS